MGYYAAPSYTSVDASLSSGYSAPAGNALSQTLSSSGPYAYAPPLWTVVNAVLQPGYTPVAGNALSATLLRPLAVGATISPSGINDGETVTPTVSLRIRTVSPTGLPPALAFGTAVGRNASELISPNNGTPSPDAVLVPDTLGDARRLFATLRQFNDHFRTGYASVEYSVRTLTLYPVYSATLLGVPSVVNTNKTLFPLSLIHI